MKRAKHVESGMGEMRNAYKISARTLAEKIPCGSSRHRWKDISTLVDLQEIGCNWIGCFWLRTGSGGRHL